MPSEGKPLIEGSAEWPTKTIPHEQLLAALYFIWDAAERGQLDMFLIGETAKQVKAGEDLQGEAVSVGVRRNEWDSGQGRIVKEFLSHELGIHIDVYLKSTLEILSYKYQGVAINIKLYEDNPCLKSFDIVFYRYETFNLPNPYDEFVKKYE